MINNELGIGRKVDMISDVNGLNALQNAIAETGAWQWWDYQKNTVQVEFTDVLLLDETKTGREARTSTIAIRFKGNSFLLLMDNLDVENSDQPWYTRFYNDEIGFLDVSMDGLRFNDQDFAAELLSKYRNKINITEISADESTLSKTQFLCAECGNYAFIASGLEIHVIGNKGEYTSEELIDASEKWWEYWKEYWQKRDTDEAFERDYACEVTIPAEYLEGVLNKLNAKETIEGE